jgi:hypothetical protein
MHATFASELFGTEIRGVQYPNREQEYYRAQAFCLSDFLSAARSTYPGALEHDNCTAAGCCANPTPSA